MIDTARKRRLGVLRNSKLERPGSGNLNSRKALIARLRRGEAARSQFVESNLTKAIVFQLRATRDRLGWSQERLAEKVGMNQNAISRLESPGYGKPTITTLKRLAAAMDVGLVVHFVPFSQMVDWASGTPRVDRGLSSDSLAVPAFSMEEEAGVFDRAPINRTNRRTNQNSRTNRISQGSKANRRSHR